MARSSTRSKQTCLKNTREAGRMPALRLFAVEEQRVRQAGCLRSRLSLPKYAIRILEDGDDNLLKHDLNDRKQ
jgi:hypothetical protein